jgi:hypothetical protein
MLKTFLEAILRKPFQLCRRILKHHKSAVPSMLVSVEGTGKKSAGIRSEEYGGRSSVVTLFFIKKSLTKMTGVLEHCREGETSC